MNFLRTSFVWVLILVSLVHFVHSTPEKADCDWVPYGDVTRIRDITDCTKFYYCQRGLPPYRSSCPTEGAYYLYFIPETTHCDFPHKAPKECFETGGEPGETTTEAPTTTTKAPRPPMLDDEPYFIIDCTRKQCGMFPNTYGACDTYVVCVNGEKLTKKCHGGQLFDVKTKECQQANLATCWTEPNAGPHITRTHADCPFHGYQATQPVETMSNGMILQNPMVTNWGSWGKWQDCPAGMYATGIYAWRRLLMQGWGLSSRDHAGIVSVSFICQTPGGNETTNIIESLAPNAPHDGWPFHYMCKGAVVGMRLNSVRQNWRDEIATDNVQGMCSCSAPVYKPYEEPKYEPQSGNRGDWTAPQYCKKGQAVCGMQTQMSDYKEYMIGTYDNTGLNNMKVKCCDVANPLDKCIPKEERLHIRDCDNSKSDEGLRCDFNAEIGLSMDYDSNTKLIDFYSSVGYTFNDEKDKISKHIETKLEEQIKNGVKLQYTWDDIVEPAVMGDMKVTPKILYIKPFEKLELYQIVGRCGYFLVRTNRYLKVIKDGKTGSIKQQTVFEI